MKILFLVLLLTCAPFATMFDPLFQANTHIKLQAGTRNSALKLETLPFRDRTGQVICPYISGFYTDTIQDGKCPDIFVYRVAKVARHSDRSVDCFYEFNMDGSFMLNFYNMKECPDAIFSLGGFNFQKMVYYDQVDRHDYFFPEREPYHTVFSGNFDYIPQVRKQRTYHNRFIAKGDIMQPW